MGFRADLFLWKTTNGVPCTKSTLPITFLPSSSDLVAEGAQKEATWLISALAYVLVQTAGFSRLPARHFGSFLRQLFSSSADMKSFLFSLWSRQLSCFSGEWADKQRQLKSSLQPWMARSSIGSLWKGRKSGSSAIDKRLSSASLLYGRNPAATSLFLSVACKEGALVLCVDGSGKPSSSVPSALILLQATHKQSLICFDPQKHLQVQETIQLAEAVDFGSTLHIIFCQNGLLLPPEAGADQLLQQLALRAAPLSQVHQRAPCAVHPCAPNDSHRRGLRRHCRTGRDCHQGARALSAVAESGVRPKEHPQGLLGHAQQVSPRGHRRDQPPLRLPRARTAHRNSKQPWIVPLDSLTADLQKHSHNIKKQDKALETLILVTSQQTILTVEDMLLKIKDKKREFKSELPKLQDCEAGKLKMTAQRIEVFSLRASPRKAATPLPSLPALSGLDRIADLEARLQSLRYE